MTEATRNASVRRSRVPQTATIEAVLIYFEEPQLLFLKSDHNMPAFAVAVEKEGMKQPYFVCQVKDRIARNYFAGKADLRYTFLRSVGHAYYFFDLAEIRDGAVSLKRVGADEALREKYWPSTGLFSRSHTSDYEYGVSSDLISAVRRYFIDGRWSTADFSRFNSKMENLYGLFSLLRKASGAVGDEVKQALNKAILDRAWEGGGSYVAFYHEVIDHLSAPLDVEKLQYSSPGEIALRGEAAVLDEVDGVVDALDNNIRALQEEYSAIYKILKEGKLLGVKAAETFSSAAMESHALSRAFKLGEDLGLQSLNSLYEACDKKSVLFIKIVLSVYRRARDLYAFHAEGRVYNEPQASHLELGIGQDFDASS